MEEADLELKVEVGVSHGLYSISCVDVQGMATLRVVNSLGWNVTHVEPDVISVDENSEVTIVSLLLKKKCVFMFLFSLLSRSMENWWVTGRYGVL